MEEEGLIREGKVEEETREEEDEAAVRSAEEEGYQGSGR